MYDKFSNIDKKKPVVNGRASIITTTLNIKVLWREQLKDAILWLIDNDYNFEWEFVLEESTESYLLTVYDMTLINNNFLDFLKLLDKNDYKFD